MLPWSWSGWVPKYQVELKLLGGFDRRENGKNRSHRLAGYWGRELCWYVGICPFLRATFLWKVSNANLYLPCPRPPTTPWTCSLMNHSPQPKPQPHAQPHAQPIQTSVNIPILQFSSTSPDSFESFLMGFLLMEAPINKSFKYGSFYTCAWFQLWFLRLLTSTHFCDFTRNSHISRSAQISFLNYILVPNWLLDLPSTKTHKYEI